MMAQQLSGCAYTCQYYHQRVNARDFHHGLAFFAVRNEKGTSGVFGEREAVSGTLLLASHHVATIGEESEEYLD